MQSKPRSSEPTVPELFILAAMILYIATDK